MVSGDFPINRFLTCTFSTASSGTVGHRTGPNIATFWQREAPRSSTPCGRPHAQECTQRTTSALRTFGGAGSAVSVVATPQGAVPGVGQGPAGCGGERSAGGAVGSRQNSQRVRGKRLERVAPAGSPATEAVSPAARPILSIGVGGDESRVPAVHLGYAPCRSDARRTSQRGISPTPPSAVDALRSSRPAWNFAKTADHVGLAAKRQTPPRVVAPQQRELTRS